MSTKTKDARPRESPPVEVHVRVHMTARPHVVSADETLATAHAIMREHRVRHLPVLRGGKLAGIVSQRDLFLLESLREVDPTSARVEEAMTDDVYVVGPNESLEDVARTMADKKYGCAVIVEGRDVVGIFTAIDALHALANLLSTRAA